MRRDAADIDAFMDASARMLGLPIDPAWKAAIRENLTVIVKHADKVANFPLPDEAEPAPLFKA